MAIELRNQIALRLVPFALMYMAGDAPLSKSSDFRKTNPYGLSLIWRPEMSAPRWRNWVNGTSVRQTERNLFFRTFEKAN
jgi:hypothetical protein